MSDDYNIDLSQLALERFKQVLLTKHLMPARLSLRDDIDSRFAALSAQGIANAADLQAALRTKRHVAQLAAATGLPEEYLTLLRREVNSYETKPRPLRDFPGIDPAVIERLAAAGITTTRDYFGCARTAEQRAALAAELGLDPAVVLELARLSDLSRVTGVGPVAARLLLEGGVGSVAQTRTMTIEAIRDRMQAAMDAHPEMEGTLSLKDAMYYRDMAEFVPLVAEFE